MAEDLEFSDSEVFILREKVISLPLAEDATSTFSLLCLPLLEAINLSLSGEPRVTFPEGDAKELQYQGI